MVVGVIFCDENYDVPKRIRSQLRDHDSSKLKSIKPTPAHGDNLAHGRFLYITVGKKFFPYSEMHDFLRSIRNMLEKEFNGISKVIMPLDMLLGRGHSLEEILAIANLAFQNTRIEVKV